MLDPLAPGGWLRFEVAAIGIPEAVGVAVVLAVVNRVPEGRRHPEQGQAQQADGLAPAATAQGAAMQQVVGGEQQHDHAVAHHQGKGKEGQGPEARPPIQLVGHGPAQAEDGQVD